MPPVLSDVLANFCFRNSRLLFCSVVVVVLLPVINLPHYGCPVLLASPSLPNSPVAYFASEVLGSNPLAVENQVNKKYQETFFFLKTNLGKNKAMQIY